MKVNEINFISLSPWNFESAQKFCNICDIFLSNICNIFETRIRNIAMEFAEFFHREFPRRETFVKKETADTQLWKRIYESLKRPVGEQIQRGKEIGNFPLGEWTNGISQSS